MKKEIKALAEYRIEKAKETFNDGLTLLEKGSLNGAVNRFYYAGFHAARALLATKEVDSSKHSGVIALFQRLFVKTGLMPINLSKALPKSFEQRQDSDYEDFVHITLPEAETTKDEISKFINECENLLKRLVSEKLVD